MGVVFSQLGIPSVMQYCVGASCRSLFTYYLDWEVMFVGPEVASRLRRHSAELSAAVDRSRPPSDESGDLREVVSVGGVVHLRTPYWYVLCGVFYF